MAVFLTTTQFLILTALADGPSHGYALQQQIQGETFGNYIRITTIYKSLELLEKQGWVGTAQSRPSEGPARKTYKITAHGMKILHVHAFTMRDLSTLALKRAA
jgi:DNA-binding PadR family transcriptional regulator